MKKKFLSSVQCIWNFEHIYSILEQWARWGPTTTTINQIKEAGMFDKCTDKAIEWSLLVNVSFIKVENFQRYLQPVDSPFLATWLSSLDSSVPIEDASIQWCYYGQMHKLSGRALRQQKMAAWGSGERRQGPKGAAGLFSRCHLADNPAEERCIFWRLSIISD